MSAPVKQLNATGSSVTAGTIQATQNDMAGLSIKMQRPQPPSAPAPAPAQPVPIQGNDSGAPTNNKTATLPTALVPQTKDMNILLLGSTGVGKSTWINGFANYLTYDTLEEAETGPMVCLIPASFTMMNEKYEEREIKIGQDDNENFTAGQSATQRPATYSFVTNTGAKIRIIDTPGIGDTRGIEQDKKNFEQIIAHVATFPVIHGICILLKPNEARISVVFEFCVKELLANLHRDAVNNIVFCFTNARSTFYRPGDSYKSLKALLASSGSSMADAPQIPLTKRTIYCMDNEAFRFLAAVKNGMTFDPSDRKNYAASWNKAVEETGRLMKHFEGLEPHETSSTVSLNHTRQTILKLARPLAEISQNIQNNIAVLKDREDELANHKLKASGLKRKLHVPGIDLVEVQIDYPKTICAAGKCTEQVEIYKASDGRRMSRTHYKQVCHDHCNLSGVNTNQINCVELQKCWCMGPGHKCHRCGCSWNVHMHITYDVTQRSVVVVDKTVEASLKKSETQAQAVARVIADCKARKSELEQEQKVITQAGAKFAVFLKNNAITPYNDALARYMEYLIKLEEDKVVLGGNSKTVEGLRASYDQYVRETEMLQNALDSGTASQDSVTLTDINAELQQLYKLRINGPTIWRLLNIASTANSFYYKEKTYRPAPKETKQWLGIRILQTVRNGLNF